jgi:ComF family protein
MTVLLRALLDGIMPGSCVLCGTALLDQHERGPVCRSCREALKPWTGLRCEACGLPLISEERRCMRCRNVTWDFDSAYPLFSYSGAVRDLLAAYKKQGRRTLSIPLAEAVAEILRERFPGRIIVPVPPRPGKTAKEGWDQVEEISRRLEKRGFSVKRILARVSAAEQKHLDRAGRTQNARSSYVLRRGSCPPRRVLLFDDIITTGATVNACAHALKSGGAATVDVLTLAAD